MREAANDLALPGFARLPLQLRLRMQHRDLHGVIRKKQQHPGTQHERRDENCDSSSYETTYFFQDLLPRNRLHLA